MYNAQPHIEVYFSGVKLFSRFVFLEDLQIVVVSWAFDVRRVNEFTKRLVYHWKSLPRIGVVKL